MSILSNRIRSYMMCHLATLNMSTVSQVQLSATQFLIPEAASHYQNKSLLPTLLSEMAHTSKTVFMAQFSYLLHQSIVLKSQTWV